MRFYSSELKGVWAEEGGDRIRLPIQKPRFKWSLRQEKAEHKALQLKTQSVRVTVKRQLPFTRVGEQKQWSAKSREGHLLLQQLVSLQFPTQRLANVLEQ